MAMALHHQLGVSDHHATHICGVVATSRCYTSASWVRVRVEANGTRPTHFFLPYVWLVKPVRRKALAMRTMVTLTQQSTLFRGLGFFTHHTGKETEAGVAVKHILVYTFPLYFISLILWLSRFTPTMSSVYMGLL